MTDARAIPVPEGAVRLRLDLAAADREALRAIADGMGVSVSALCRLAMGLVAAGGAPGLVEGVRAEVLRLRGEAAAAGEARARARRPRGRPKGS